jgi:ActR/RegA family two-component response regulator
MTNPNRVLVSEDTELWQGIIARLFAGTPFELHQARDLETTISELERRFFNVVIVDLGLDPVDEDRLDGVETMRKIRAFDEGTQAIVLTGKGTVDLAVAALRDFRVYHFLQKEKLEPAQFVRMLEEASMQAYRLVRGPGRLYPLDASIEPVDWHRFSSLLQVRENDLKNVFSALVRNCMPARFRGKRLRPELTAAGNAVTAQLWSRWFGTAVRILAGKHGDGTLSSAGDEVYSHHLDTAAGFALPVEESFETYLE